MRFDAAQLETLVAIIDFGTFDAAARHLHVTPSAVSQRIRALEHAAGQVLIRRASPASVTTAGEGLLRLGRQMRLLADEAATDLETTLVLEMPIAVNADSLVTWFRPVFGSVASRPGTALKLHVEDEAFSHELLRAGEVVAAVTTAPPPVQGCVIEPLGYLRYTPVASPGLREKFRVRRNSVDWSAIPLIVFNEKDRLQHDVLAAHGVQRPRIVHRVPSAHEFYEAVRYGLGWGMVPEPQARHDLAAGALTRLPGARETDVPLHWQRWKLDSPTLNQLSRDVHAAAAQSLRPRPSRLDKPR